MLIFRPATPSRSTTIARPVGVVEIKELFEELATSVVYHQPEDLRAHMVEELGRIRERQEKERVGSMIFTDEDISTMFGMFDPTGKGVISQAQFKQAVAALGLAGAAVPQTKKIDIAAFTSAINSARAAS